MGACDPAYGECTSSSAGTPEGQRQTGPAPRLFAEIISQDGDITMPELASALFDATGVHAHPDAIGRFLRKLGYSYKKSRWSPPNAAVLR